MAQVFRVTPAPVADPGDEGAATHRAPSAIAALSDRQKACLRLIDERYQVKEIANALSLTPAAVIERLRSARTTLGVSTSREAAQLLAIAERNDTYISYGDMPADLAEQGFSGFLRSSGNGPRPAMLEEAQATFDVAEAPSLRLPQTAPDTFRRAFDRLTIRHHIAIAAVATFLLLAVLIGAAAMLDTATKLHRDFRAQRQSPGAPAH